MATLKFRLNRKNAGGTYDTIHYETSSNIVLRPRGESVEAALSRADAHMEDRDNPHGVNAGQIGAASSVHIHDASQITGGILGGAVSANASAQASLEYAQVRNIYAGTTDIGVGAPLPSGTIYLVYE